MTARLGVVGRRQLRRGAAVLAAGLLVAGLAACGDGESPAPKPAHADAVALSAEVPDDLSIGVVVSLASAPGQGVEWRDAAEGARVAAQRFQLGGADVTLVGANDKGTAQGATAAVKSLIGAGVAGIVLASSGTHLQAAVQEAAALGTPVLLPYVEDTTALPPHAWLTGPDGTVADGRLLQALRQRGARRPFLVDAGGGPIDALVPSGTATFRAGGDPSVLVKTLRQRQTSTNTAFDAVVVSGPAALQATVVQAMQGARIGVPFFLTPQALSPTFPAALAKANGSLSDEFITAGLDVGDAGALASSPAGRSLAAYFSALRMTAADPEVQDLLGDRPFTAVVGAADVRSHDAVVALVRASAAAGSTAPAEVATALSGLRLGSDAGTAGPALDFTSATAVGSDAVVALGATTASPGLRPGTGATPPALFWFPMPAS